MVQQNSRDDDGRRVGGRRRLRLSRHHQENCNDDDQRVLVSVGGATRYELARSIIYQVQYISGCGVGDDSPLGDGLLASRLKGNANPGRSGDVC